MKFIIQIVALSEREYEDYTINVYLIVPQGRNFKEDMEKYATKSAQDTQDKLIELGYTKYEMCEAHLNNDMRWEWR